MASRKGQFKKGGGRIGGATRARRSHSRKSMTHSPRVITVTKTRTRHVKAKRSHRKHKGHGPMKLTHLALASAGLAFLTGPKSPIASIKETAEKIPGAKTFGAPAIIGLACLGVDRFVKPNKWLKLLGTAGIVLAAVQVGTQGQDFKFVGEGDESSGDFDLEGDDDMGDDEMGDDDVGDDETGDYDE